MKLRRIQTGHYASKDGRYEILRDPSGGDHVGGWGYSSWLVFDNEDESREAMMIPPWGNQFPTLRDARGALAGVIKRGTS